MLWKRNHEKFRRFIALFVGLTVVGYVGYVLYPAMPPWMASWHHYTGGPVYRVAPVVWDHLGIHAAAALFTKGSAFDNDIAAMPSLHAAYTMLLLLFFWPRARRRVRGLLAGYVVAMGITLVYAGEHFVADGGRLGVRRRRLLLGLTAARPHPGQRAPGRRPARRPRSR